MTLSRQQRTILERGVQSNLANNPGVSTVALFVGSQIAEHMPVVNKVRTLAHWIVSQALDQPTPDMLINMIELVDSGTANFSELVAFKEAMKQDPSLWNPQKERAFFHEFDRNVLRSAAFLGPVVAALIAAAVWWFGLSDREPPQRPAIVDVTLIDGLEAEDVLQVDYRGAKDADGGSGIKEVRLWFRHLANGEWVASELTRTGPEGSMMFSSWSGPGKYFFDLVATDQSGNASPSPKGTGGQKDHHKRPEITAAELITEPHSETSSFATTDVSAMTADSLTDAEWIDIPLYFHVVHNGDEGKIKKQVVEKQISVLNAAYTPGKIRFKMKESDLNYSNSPQWFNHEYGSSAELEMKNSLQRDPTLGLNVYTTMINGGLLEYSVFPWDLKTKPESDGVVVLYSTLPGGHSAPFNLGDSMVHSVGHWLGLYHTFQGGCAGEGDHVSDTPAHATANGGVPKIGEPNGACKPGELAPIDNYMNYINDIAMQKFTLGQYVRMRESIAKFRPGLL